MKTRLTIVRWPADATNAKRENWKELIPQTDAVLEGASVTGGKLLAQYEHNATSN